MYRRIKSSSKIYVGDKLALDKNGCVRRWLPGDTQIGVATQTRSAGNLVEVRVGQSQPTHSPQIIADKLYAERQREIIRPNRYEENATPAPSGKLSPQVRALMKAEAKERRARILAETKQAEEKLRAEIAENIEHEKRRQRLAAARNEMPATPIDEGVRFIAPPPPEERGVASTSQILIISELDEAAKPVAAVIARITEAHKPSSRRMRLTD